MAPLILAFLLHTPAYGQGTEVLHSVEVASTGEFDRDYVESLIDLEPGYHLQRADVARAMRRLYALGLFNNIRVYRQELLPGLVTLRFQLVPAERIASFDISGVPRDLRRKLASALRIGAYDAFERGIEAELLGRARRAMASAGYHEPRIELEKSRGNARDLRYRVRIKPGTPTRVEGIELKGDLGFRAPLIRRWFQVRSGDIDSEEEAERGLTRLREAYRDRGYPNAEIVLGRVSAAPHRQRLVLRIRPGRRLRFVFEGNRVVSDRSLYRWVRQRDLDRALNDEYVNLEDIQAILAEPFVALGHADAVVRTHLQERNDHLLVRVAVDEGPAFRLVDIRFSGVSAYGESKLVDQIRAEMVPPSRVGKVFRPALAQRRPVPRDKLLVPDRLADSLATLRRVYRSEGYLAAEISAPVRRGPPSSTELHLEVTEGPQWKIESLDFDGVRFVSKRGLRSALRRSDPSTAVRRGGPYSPGLVEKGRVVLIRRYRDEGFLYVKVETMVRQDEEKHEADIRYIVDEGPRVRVRKRLVTGLRHTERTTVDNMLSVSEGDVYRVDQVVRDQRSLGSLGIFSTVNMGLVAPSEPEREKDVIVSLQEQDRQSIQPFVGVSTAEGIRGGVEYLHRNLGGRAAALSLSARFNRQVFFFLYGPFQESLESRYEGLSSSEQITQALERDIRAGLRSAWLRGFPIRANTRADLVHRNDITLPFSQSSVELILGLDTYPGERTQLSIEARVKDAQVELCDTGQDPNCQASGTTRNRELTNGRRRSFRWGPRFTADWRDSPFNTRRGLFVDGGLSYVQGLFDSATQADNPFGFLAFDTKAVGYIPASGATLVLSAKAGTLVPVEGDAFPIEERFLLGGREDLRGYVEDSVVAWDACTVADRALVDQQCVYKPERGPAITTGGAHILALRGEWRVPMTRSSASVLFVDAGNLWIDWPEALDLRFGVGMGVRYRTPVGALSVDVGLNPRPQSRFAEDFSPRIHLSVGSL